MTKYFVFAREWVEWWCSPPFPIEAFDDVPDDRLREAIRRWQADHPSNEHRTGGASGFVVPGEPYRPMPRGSNELDFVTNQRFLVECATREEGRLVGEVVHRELKRQGIEGTRVGCVAEGELSTVELVEAEAQVASRDPLVRLAQDVQHRVRIRSEPVAVVEEGGPMLASPTERSAFKKVGLQWHFTFMGEEAFAKDKLGFQYLAYLLARPNQDVPVEDLLASAGRGAEIGRGNPQRESDAQAKKEYERRLEQIDSELEEAESNNDFGRQEALKAEREELADDVRRRFRGRSPRLPSPSKRSRDRVGKAITQAMEVLAVEIPGLHEHLLNTVKTPSGVTPRYAPPEKVDWDLG